MASMLENMVSLALFFNRARSTEYKNNFKYTHTSQRAQSTDKHAHIGLRRHVTIAHRGHRHQRPPKPQGDAVEVVVRIRLYPLRVVHQTREYHYPKH